VGIGGDIAKRIDITDIAPAAAQLRLAQVARDAAEPRTHALRIAQLAQMSPRDDERILGNVFTEREIARDRKGDGGDGTMMTLDEATERANVTRNARGNELLI
jgi:hypothetical protein